VIKQCKKYISKLHFQNSCTGGELAGGQEGRCRGRSWEESEASFDNGDHFFLLLSQKSSSTAHRKCVEIQMEKSIFGTAAAAAAHDVHVHRKLNWRKNYPNPSSWAGKNPGREKSFWEKQLKRTQLLQR
jgi:hypothetical protein